MLKKNLIANLANQLLGTGFPIFTQIYIVRHLNIVDIGFWNTLLAAQIIVTLSVSFVSLQAIKQISSTEDTDVQSMYVTNIFGLTYVLMVVPLTLTLGFLIEEYRADWMIVAICFMPLLTMPLAAEYYLQATLKNDVIFYRRLFSRVVFLALLLTLVKDSSDFMVYACIVSLTLVSEHLVNLFFVRKLFNFRLLSLAKQKEMLATSIGYLPFNLSYNTLPQISVLIGARVLQAETLAVFSILVKLVNLATTFVSSSVMVIYPYRLNRRRGRPQSGGAAARDDYYLFFSLTALVALAVVLGLILLRPLVYYLFLDNQPGRFGNLEYAILACYVFVHAVYNYVVFNHFFARNQVKKAVIANASMVMIFASVILAASLHKSSVSISGVFLLAAIIPASALVILSYRERKADSSREFS